MFRIWKHKNYWYLRNQGLERSNKLDRARGLTEYAEEWTSECDSTSKKLKHKKRSNTRHYSANWTRQVGNKPRRRRSTLQFKYSNALKMKLIILVFVVIGVLGIQYLKRKRGLDALRVHARQIIDKHWRISRHLQKGEINLKEISIRIANNSYNCHSIFT